MLELPPALFIEGLSNIITTLYPCLQILSTSDAILKCKVGLSTKKIEYLKDLSVRVADHRLDLKLLPAMTDEDIINQLTEVKGIGRWTADMFLIFCLGRPDVLPVGDLGIRKESVFTP